MLSSNNKLKTLPESFRTDRWTENELNCMADVEAHYKGSNINLFLEEHLTGQTREAIHTQQIYNERRQLESASIAQGHYRRRSL